MGEWGPIITSVHRGGFLFDPTIKILNQLHQVPVPGNDDHILTHVRHHQGCSAYKAMQDMPHKAIDAAFGQFAVLAYFETAQEAVQSVPIWKSLWIDRQDI